LNEVGGYAALITSGVAFCVAAVAYVRAHLTAKQQIEADKLAKIVAQVTEKMKEK